MGLILKGLVWSPNKQYFVMLSLSVAEILGEEDTLVAPFLFSTTRLSVHKKGRISASSSIDVSATQVLSYWALKIIAYSEITKIPLKWAPQRGVPANAIGDPDPQTFVY